MTVLGFGIEIGLVFGMLIFLMSVMIIFLPKMQKGKKSNEASRELPYALRQMATELRAGLGLHESMKSVALSGYGPLSEEFARTLEEIKYGETTENALMDMSERIDSDGKSSSSDNSDIIQRWGSFKDAQCYSRRCSL
jgi:flagellar protein FlaJ